VYPGIYVSPVRQVRLRMSGVRTDVDNQGEEAAAMRLATDATILRSMGEHKHTSE
jgi:hypothetical protein